MQNYNMVGTKVLLGNREHKNDFGEQGNTSIITGEYEIGTHSPPGSAS